MAAKIVNYPIRVPRNLFDLEFGKELGDSKNKCYAFPLL